MTNKLARAQDNSNRESVEKRIVEGSTILLSTLNDALYNLAYSIYQGSQTGNERVKPADDDPSNAVTNKLAGTAAANVEPAGACKKKENLC